MKDCRLTIQLDVITEGYEPATHAEWLFPRIGIIPPRTAVMLLTRTAVRGSDCGIGTYSMRSDDLGMTWGEPLAQPALGRMPYDGGRLEICAWDMVPAWHAGSGKLLALGHTVTYRSGGLHPVFDRDIPTFASYSVYDERTRGWSAWRYLEFPDNEHFFLAAGGAGQRVDLPNGDILWPIYFMDRKDVSGKDFFANSCFAATVVRCRFDGRDMTYVEHGTEMAIANPRGLNEPSLVKCGDRFYLTLRNDERGYVTTSPDGLHFEEVVPWMFDDGTELGSYNTQQHWVVLRDGLFLVYTRRNANNDHIVRNRAPLFLAQVDTERLCVIRETERILLPDKGAQFGNGGVTNATADEVWVTDAEGMQGDAEDPFDVERTMRRGANNRVYLARLAW